MTCTAVHASRPPPCPPPLSSSYLCPHPQLIFRQLLEPPTPPPVPVGSQVGYWLMLITAGAELLGDRRLEEEEEERMLPVRLRCIFVCVAADTLNPHRTHPHLGLPGARTAVCRHRRPLHHRFFCWGGGVFGEGIEKDDVTLSAWLCGGCCGLTPSHRRVHTPFPSANKPRDAPKRHSSPLRPVVERPSHGQSPFYMCPHCLWQCRHSCVIL